MDLQKELNRKDDTCNDVDFEDGDFPALQSDYDRRQHAHHMVTGLNAQHKSVPDYSTGRIHTQNNLFPQHFTQAQNTTTYFSPDNTLLKVDQTP